MLARSLRAALVAALSLAVAGSASGCVPAEPSRPLPASVRPSSPLPADDPAGAAGTHWAPSAEPGTLASGLSAPWSVVPLPGGGALISERDSGVVRELSVDGGVREAGVVPGVVSGGEAGLHGLAVREVAGTRWLYAYHGAGSDNRVVRQRLEGEPGALRLGESEVIVSGIARARNHNGGRIAFGPDGLLYITTGDAGDPDAAQDSNSLNGKILRVTPGGEAAPGNPAATAVYSLGHRNVQGIAWTADGTMWASEFGQNTWDELNRIEPGANYGWPIHEGDAGAAGFMDPVVVWRTDAASPSGIAAVGDTVFVAGLRGERLWVVDTSGGTVAGEPVAVLKGEQGRLRDVVAAPDGGLWVLTNNTDGRGSPRDSDDVLLRMRLTETD